LAGKIGYCIIMVVLALHRYFNRPKVKYWVSIYQYQSDLTLMNISSTFEGRNNLSINK